MANAFGLVLSVFYRSFWGIAVPLLLAKFDPDVPSWFGYLAFSGVAWIYIVQFRLYQEINRLYVTKGQKPPLVSWWIVVPGLKPNCGPAADSFPE